MDEVDVGSTGGAFLQHGGEDGAGVAMEGVGMEEKEEKWEGCELSWGDARAR